MNVDESVSSGRRLIHLAGDRHEALHRFDVSTFIGGSMNFAVDIIGVYRRSSAFIGGKSLFLV